MATEKPRHMDPKGEERIAALEAELARVQAENRELKDTRDFLLEQLPIVYSVFDSKGVFQELTGKGLERLHMQEGEGVGESVFELYAEVKPVLASIRKALEGESVNGEWELDQDQFYRYAYRPIWNDERHLSRILGVALDITDLVREQRINEYTARQLAFFFKHVPAAIATFDREMRYLRVSDRWIEDYRLQGVELIGRNHYEVFPETPERWRAVHDRCLKGAVESCVEDPLPREGGRIDYVNWVSAPWYDEHDEVGGLIFFTEVMNEQVAAKKKLIELNRQLSESNARLAGFADSLGSKVLQPLNLLINWLDTSIAAMGPDHVSAPQMKSLREELVASKELIVSFMKETE